MPGIRSKRPLLATYKALPVQKPAASFVVPPGARSCGKYAWRNEPRAAMAASINENIPLSSSPLSGFSNITLLRSMFVNSVSSKSWLLSPAISFLLYLCQPKKPFLFNLDRNRLLAWMMKQTVYKQYCGGETPMETKATMRQMRELGFRGTIITLATEIVFDNIKQEAHGLGVDTKSATTSTACPYIEGWRQRTLGAIQLLDEGDQLAIKLTGAGPVVTDALASGQPLPPEMLRTLDEICTLCMKRQARVLIDAESQLYQFGIFDVGIDLMRKYNQNNSAVVFNTYQAYLKSTMSTIGTHLAAARDDQFTLGLKLVRGAYLSTEKRSLIHDTKEDTDAAYNKIATGALCQELAGFGGAASDNAFPSLHLILASHNKKSILAANELHRHRLQQSLPTVPVGFAQLQGMSDELSFGLLQSRKDKCIAGPEVFKCTTWGRMDECLGYLARRASENRDAAGRTQDELEALKKEWRRRWRHFLGIKRKQTAA